MALLKKVKPRKVGEKIEWDALRTATIRAAMLTQIKADTEVLENVGANYFTAKAQRAFSRICAAMELYHETWDREEDLNDE